PASDEGKQASQLELKRASAEALPNLSPRQEEVIRMQFGIGTDPQSIEEIGKHFAVTKKRIYQIEEGAFRKLNRYFPQRGKRPVRGIPRRGPRESQVEPALFFYNLPLFKFFREEAAAFGFTRF